VGCRRTSPTLASERVLAADSRFVATDLEIRYLNRVRALAALDELVQAGAVREIGCSNFLADQLVAADEAVKDGAVRFVSVQNHYNLLRRGDEADVLPSCQRLGLAHIPYFPLASGLLTGKYRRGEPPPEGTRLAAWGDRADAMLSERNFDQIDRLTAWAEARGHSILELAIAWLLAKAHGRLGHRRGDHGRPGECQHRRNLAALGRGGRGGRRDHGRVVIPPVA
jgi:diketogulonate reductase-like aldo/keto reductase